MGVGGAYIGWPEDHTSLLTSYWPLTATGKGPRSRFSACAGLRPLRPGDVLPAWLLLPAGLGVWELPVPLRLVGRYQ